MSRHQVTVAGSAVDFELSPVPGSGRLRVRASGLTPFTVRSAEEAAEAVRQLVFVAARPALYQGWC